MKSKTLIKRIALSLSAFLLLVTAFTIYANIKVEHETKERIYTDVDSIPYNKAALLLGTNPLNRWGRPNSYFTNRINTAAELYHAGKVDFIIASGDNHTKEYDEPTAMRDSLMAHGVPEDRIILDFAGFRTLDSVVRAKDGMTMRIVEPAIVRTGIDSLIVEFRNTRKTEGMTGEWFRIDRKAADGQWQELPYDRKYENADGEVAVIFNAIGWIVGPDTSFRMTVKPWFYKFDRTPGTYRLAKTFSYPPYPRTEPSDTAFVEFQIR